MHDEVKKILDSKIKITSTSVRIPVLVSHAVSVNVEFNKKYKLDEVVQAHTDLGNRKITGPAIIIPN